MSKHLVLIADAGRASLYSLNTQHHPSSTQPPKLVESSSFVNPEKRMPQGDVFTTTRSGLRQGAGGEAIHGVDDHRDAHIENEERQFAKHIVEQIEQVAREGDTDHLVVVAPPAMMGRLRNVSSGRFRGCSSVDELTKDLSGFTPHEVHKHLAGEGLLPQPMRLGH